MMLAFMGHRHPIPRMKGEECCCCVCIYYRKNINIKAKRPATTLKTQLSNTEQHNLYKNDCKTTDVTVPWLQQLLLFHIQALPNPPCP